MIYDENIIKEILPAIQNNVLNALNVSGEWDVAYRWSWR